MNVNIEVTHRNRNDMCWTERSASGYYGGTVKAMPMPMPMRHRRSSNIRPKLARA